MRRTRGLGGTPVAAIAPVAMIESRALERSFGYVETHRSEQDGFRCLIMRKELP